MFETNDSQGSFFTQFDEKGVDTDLTIKPLVDQPFDLFLNVDSGETSTHFNQSPRNARYARMDSDECSTAPSSPHQDESSLWGSEAVMNDVPLNNSPFEEDIWTIQHTEPKTLNTLSWDTRNSHFPTYEQRKLAQKNVGTPFLTEAPLSFFDPLIDRLNNTSISSSRMPTTPEPTASPADIKSTTTVIYEISLVKALLQAIEGISSTYFYWDKDGVLRSRMHQSVRILGVSRSAIEPMIDDILLFGTQLRALERVASTCRSQPETYGLTGMAFGCCLAELHLNIQYSIMNTFSATPADYYRLSLIKLHQYIHHLSTVVHKLYTDLCHCHPGNIHSDSDIDAASGFSIPFGAQLLNLLHAQIQQFDLALSGSLAFYKQICLVFLKFSSVPYLQILSKWLHLSHGTSSDLSINQWDPYGEFFIEQEVAFDSDLMQQFQIRTEATLPYFIDEKLARHIMLSGITLRILKNIKPEHPLFHLQESFSLRHTLSNNEYTEYRRVLDHMCQSIQSYNNGEVLNVDIYGSVSTDVDHRNQHEIEDLADISLTDNPTNNDTLMPEIPKLPLLQKNIDLYSDFMTTLNNLLKQQQQQHDEEHTTTTTTTFTTKYTDAYMPTLNTMTQQSYVKPLKQWCFLLNESFMLSFLKQYKLQQHLSLLSDVFLLKNGAFAAGLKLIFFPAQDQVRLNHRSRWPPKTVELSMALRNLLLESKINNNLENDQLISFTVRNTSNAATCRWMNPQAVEALDFLKVNYCAKYPLNMVITTTIINKYNRIFTFLLQLLRTSTVTKLCYCILRKQEWQSNATRRKIFQMCFQFDQFINALQGYVHGTAIENNWKSFERNVSTMILKRQLDGPSSDADSSSSSSSSNSSAQPITDYTPMITEPYAFRDYHEHILDRILIQCFLKSKQSRVMNVLHPILQDVISFGTAVDEYQHAKTTSDNSSTAEKKFDRKCESIFEQFQANVSVFVRVLNLMEAKGSGSLTNILCHDDSGTSTSNNNNNNNSSRAESTANNRDGKNNVFIELYCRNEAKEGLDNFVKDLLIRLGFNGFYDRTEKDE